MRATTLVFAFLVLLALPISAHPSSTLRVGSQVLTAGDSSERVTALLGRPSSKSHRRSKRARGRRDCGCLDALSSLQGMDPSRNGRMGSEQRANGFAAGYSEGLEGLGEIGRFDSAQSLQRPDHGFAGTQQMS